MIMKANLANFQGNVVKTATITSNDPDDPVQALKLEGFVKPIVLMKPSPNVALRAPAGPLSESVVELIAAKTPFHITSIDTNLAGSINYSLQTVSEGTDYRLKISNKIRRGNYSGFIRLKTDLPRVPYLFVRVMGIIKGEISATPETVMIGELSAGMPVRSGSVTVTSNEDKPFKITGLTYDKALMSVSQKKLENRNGFLLNIRPELQSAKPGSVKQAPLAVETNVGPYGKADVLVIIFNNSSGAPTRR